MLLYNKDISKRKKGILTIIFFFCFLLDLFFGTSKIPLFLASFCAIVIVYEFVSPYIKK